MRRQSVFGLISHLGFAVIGAVFVYRGLKPTSQNYPVWVRYASVSLGAFVVVISFLRMFRLVR
jgi:hypothetical protein